MYSKAGASAYALAEEELRPLGTGIEDLPKHRVRALVRKRISAETASTLAECFVRLVPRRVQRYSEQRVDFPIARTIRANPILLIRVPRTSSVSLAMQIYGRIIGIPHRTALFYRRSDPAFFQTATKIAVVRNPWTRVLSAYSYLRSTGTDVSAPDARTRERLAAIRSLEHFVYDYLEPNASRLHRLDPTVQSQGSYLCDDAGRVIVDHVFRFENLRPLNDFLAVKGFGDAMYHLNASNRRSSTMLRSAPLIEAIGRIYATDANLFDYQPPV